MTTGRERPRRARGWEGVISIVTAVCNEERAIPELYRRISAVLDETPLRWELIFVEDSSTDDSVRKIRELCASDSRVKGVFLTRSFGHHAAVSAGLDFGTGDHFLMMDGDLQHRPEDIPRLLGPYFEEGFDIVYGQRTTRQPLLKEVGSRLANRLANMLSDTPLDLNSGMFRVFSRQVRDELVNMPERTRFLVGMMSWLGFEGKKVPIEEDPRPYGETKYTIRRLFELAANYITSFSTRPLRLAVWLGLATSIGSLCLGVYFLIEALVFGVEVSGFPTLIVMLTTLGGMILLVLGIIGEYIGKMFVEVKSRRLYVVRGTLNVEPEELGMCDPAVSGRYGAAPRAT